MDKEFLQKRIREIADYPKPGISFKDLSPLFADPDAFEQCISGMANLYDPEAYDCIAAIEARGFIIGSALAVRTHKGFIPLRKPGKLPAKTDKVSYSLEYGEDALEIHLDALRPRQRVLIVDDLLATGGTASAAIQLVERQQATVVGAAFVVDLTFLNGAQKLSPISTKALLQY